VIEAFCRSALGAALVQDAAGLPHWREVYVGIPYGDGVLERYIDLLYRSPDGLVVVDYKTDSLRGEAALQDKIERYRVQLQAYGGAVTEAAGEAVSGLVLLFLNARGAARTVGVEM
jgi:ATP-dependent exoDNAse (exonuclease V) beta subunit